MAPVGPGHTADHTWECWLSVPACACLAVFFSFTPLKLTVFMLSAQIICYFNCFFLIKNKLTPLYMSKSCLYFLSYKPFVSFVMYDSWFLCLIIHSTI